MAETRLAQAAPMGLGIVAADGHIIHYNPRLAELLGTSQHLADALGQDAYASFNHAIENLQQNGGEQILILSVRDQWQRWHLTPLDNHFYIAVQPAGPPSTTEHTPTVSEDGQHTEGTRPEIQETVQSSIQQILIALRQIMPPHDLTALLLVEQETRQARLVRFISSLPAEKIAHLQGLTLPIAETKHLNYMASTRNPLLMLDLEVDPNWDAGQQARWIRSYLGAPIFLDDELTGFLGLSSAEPNTFDERHLSSLQAFAAHVALSMRNAQLYTQERDQRQLAEALHQTALALNSTLDLSEVFREIMTNIERLVPHEASNIMLIENGEAYMVAWYGDGYQRRGLQDWLMQLRVSVAENPLMHTCVETQDVIVIPDTRHDARWLQWPPADWTLAHIKAPIIINQQVIGVIQVDSDQPNHFTQQHGEWLRIFATQAALAIRNAQRYTAEQEQRQYAEALQDVVAILNSTLNLQQVFERILDNIARLVPHEASNIYMIRGDYTYTVGARGYESRGLAQWIREVTLLLESAPIHHKIMQTHTFYITHDTSEEPNWLTLPETSWIRSNLCVPIILAGEVIGFLNLDSTEPYFFTEQHGRWMITLAEQASLAIHNAQLYTRLEREQLQQAAILDASGEGIYYAQDDVIEYANPKLSELIGRAPENIIGIPIHDLWSTRDQSKEQLLRDLHTTLANNGVWRHSVRLLHRDGHTFEAAFTISRIDNRSVGIVRDLSDEKRLQARQIRFITHAAHELRHPITNMSTRLYLMRRRPEELESHIETLEGITKRMTRLIEDMLEISRFEQNLVTKHDDFVPIQQLITEAIQSHHEAATALDITIDLTAPTDNHITLRADVRRLMQLIDILIDNAINHTPAYGRIAIHIRRIDDGVEISVHDGGKALRNIEQLFEPFLRPSEGNIITTGLELAIAQHIVELHYGTIRATHHPEQGIVITAFIPNP